MRLVVFLAVLLPATSPLLAQPVVSLAPVASGLGSVTGVTHAGDGSVRLFLTLQNGRILIHDGTSVLPTPFLDIRSLVTSGGERGLLSTAFHPRYPENGFFYVNYTDLAGDTVVARYTVSAADPDRADPASAHVILTQDQPFSNHNGGQLQFGPGGRLFIGMGDGGSANDPFGNAQDPETFLGKMLRIDVDGGDPYAIPDDNPFVGVPGTLPEIWAFGLRNPWRFSFDRMTGDLIIGDVGQGSREEVDFEPAGLGGRNYGWADMEGSICRLPPGGCDGYVPPVLEYDHGQGNCSITGGHRYRGLRFPALAGVYFYGDYCSGRLWGARPSGETWTTDLLLDTSFNISSFGEDEEGTLYVGTTDGELFRIEGESFRRGDLDGAGGADVLWQNAASGAVAAWLMDGVSIQSGPLLIGGLPDPALRVTGAHDFDGDLDTDLLWQHSTQGWLAVTLLDGLVPVASAPLSPDREPDLDWQIVGTGDLDLDGGPDIVWRNRADGRIRAWLMDGTVRRTEVPLLGGAPLDPAWDVAAVADLTRDGRLDLVIRHPALGLVAVLVMHGTVLTDLRPLTPLTVDPVWTLVASGDLAGDGGTTDLVWRHAAGVLAGTFLEGTTITGGALFSPAVAPGPDWLPAGPR